MKKSFLTLWAIMLTFGLSCSVEAYFSDIRIVSRDSWVIIYESNDRIYPIYVALDPKHMLLSLGISSGIIASLLTLYGTVDIAHGLKNLIRRDYSSEDDGSELPRGVIMCSFATVFGALAVKAIHHATR